MSRMFRTSDVILIAAMLAGAGTTYQLKHDAEERLAHIRKLEADIRYEEDTLAFLGNLREDSSGKGDETIPSRTKETR